MNLHLQRHPTYVEGCFGCKVGSLKIAYCQSSGPRGDYTVQKRGDYELDEFRKARAAGVQPDSTRLRSTRKAMEWSEKTGIAYSEEAKLAYDTGKAQERLD